MVECLELQEARLCFLGGAAVTMRSFARAPVGTHVLMCPQLQSLQFRHRIVVKHQRLAIYLKLKKIVYSWYRGCKGQACVATNTPEETLCLLGSYGVDLDVKNATRASSCGFSEEDIGWLHPSMNPASQPTPDGKPSCSVVTPEGVISEVWADCIDGQPELRYRLNFSSDWSMGEGLYDCQINPRCTTSLAFKSTLICHSTELENGPVEESMDLDRELDIGEDMASSSDSNGILWLKFLLLWLLLLFLAVV